MNMYVMKINKQSINDCTMNRALFYTTFRAMDLSPKRQIDNWFKPEVSYKTKLCS